MAAVCAVTGVVYFILYVRVRMTDRGHPDEPRFPADQLQALQEKEDRYLSRHGSALLLFFLLGIAILAMIAYR